MALLMQAISFLLRRKGAQYLFCFLGPALGVVLFIPADIVQKPRIYADHHEPFDRNRLHPVAIGFYKDEGGAVDADTRAVEDAVAEFFIVARARPSRAGAKPRDRYRKAFLQWQSGP